MKDESFQLQTKNESCFFCNKSLSATIDCSEEGQSQDTIVLRCGHAYHLKCGKGWVIKSKKTIESMRQSDIKISKCPECLLTERDFDDTKKKSLDSSRYKTSEEIEAIEKQVFQPQILSSKQVEYSNYPATPHQLMCHLEEEKEKEREDIRVNGLSSSVKHTKNSYSRNTDNNFHSDDDEDEDDDSDNIISEEEYGEMSQSKKRAFIPVLKWGRVTTTKIDYDYLEENNYNNMPDLYNANVNIHEIYHAIGIKSWQDLVDKLGFTKEYLADSKLYPTEYLVEKYNISYLNLVNDMDMGLKDFISIQFSATELRLLGVTLSRLIGEFSAKKKDIIDFKFKINEWQYLGMDFENLLKLNMTQKDFIKSGWKPSLIQKFLKLSESQMKTLNLDTLVGNSRSKKKALSTNATTTSGTKTKKKSIKKL